MTHVFVTPPPRRRRARLYESQLANLFGASDAMADAVRGFGAKVAGLRGAPAYAERYWALARR